MRVLYKEKGKQPIVTDIKKTHKNISTLIGSESVDHDKVVIPGCSDIYLFFERYDKSKEGTLIFYKGTPGHAESFKEVDLSPSEIECICEEFGLTAQFLSQRIVEIEIESRLSLYCELLENKGLHLGGILKSILKGEMDAIAKLAFKEGQNSSI